MICYYRSMGLVIQSLSLHVVIVLIYAIMNFLLEGEYIHSFSWTICTNSHTSRYHLSFYLKTPSIC